jgi:3'-5' exoribonuclease
MIKGIYVKDLKTGCFLDNELFVVKSMEKKIASNGKSFISVELADKTGSIKGIKFDCSSFPEDGSFVGITGSVSSFQDVLNIKISSFYEIKDVDPDMASKLMPSSKYGFEELKNWFDLTYKYLNQQEEIYRYLLDKIFVESIQEKFLNHPAAMSMHGCWRHGLLEHTMNVYLICEQLCKYYGNIVFPELNKNLVLFSAFIHDLGKIFEYTVKGPIIKRSDLGETIGHITMANMKIETAWFEFPENKKTEENRKIKNDILHIISSHHGNLKWGSPVNPQTPEALIVHQADLTDARLINYSMDKKKGWE